MRTSRRSVLTATVATVSLPLLAACGGSPSASAPPTTAAASPPTTAPTGSGPVDVAYAGSLVDLMDHDVAPGFDHATGYRFTGTSGDSGALANQLQAKTLQADVFISASPSKNAALEGAAHGNLVTWYATFATSPLVLGYNPSSRFATQLKTEPWYQVVTSPGFLLGRTDPATDPKGQLTVSALDQAAGAHGLPALSALATSDANVFPENTLVGRLQAGQLDAGFFYAVEAAVAKIPTAPLTGTSLHATYTLTVLANAPHPAAARAFIAYLLGPAGATALGTEGLTLTSPPSVSGAAPHDLQSILTAG